MVAAASLTACDWMQKRTSPRASAIAATRTNLIKNACASRAAYDRLVKLAFDEAIEVRNADPVNLATLAAHIVARMESPLVKSRDDVLDVTVCSGRFILELPPGSERGFGGERRLAADIEYAAQPAVDGSGLVYRVRGAEPIIYKLAAFDLRARSYASQPAGEQPRLIWLRAGEEGAPDRPPVKPVDGILAPPGASAPAIAQPRRVRARMVEDSPPPPKVKPVREAKAKPTPRITAVRLASTATRKDKVKAGGQEAATPKPKAAQVKSVSAAPKPNASRMRDIEAALAALETNPKPKAMPRRPTKPAIARLAAPPSEPRPKSSRLSELERILAEPPSQPDPRSNAPVKMASSKPKPPPRQLDSAAKLPVARVQPAAGRPANAGRPTSACGHARSRGEYLVCSNRKLVALDRQTAVLFSSAMNDADRWTRDALARTRSRFLAWRDRCLSSDCIEDAYVERMAEIRDIMREARY